MAKNVGRGKARAGAVTGRSQVFNTQSGRWTKRDTSSGKFMSVKESPGPYKGVRKEK